MGYRSVIDCFGDRLNPAKCLNCYGTGIYDAVIELLDVISGRDLFNCKWFPSKQCGRDAYS